MCEVLTITLVLVPEVFSVQVNQRSIVISPFWSYIKNCHKLHIRCYRYFFVLPLEQFVAEGRKTISFFVQLRKTKNLVHQGVLHVKIVHATYIFFFTRQVTQVKFSKKSISEGTFEIRSSSKNQLIENSTLFF